MSTILPPDMVSETVPSDLAGDWDGWRCQWFS